MNSKSFFPSPIGTCKVIFSPANKFLNSSDLLKDKYTFTVLVLEFSSAPIALIEANILKLSTVMAVIVFPILKLVTLKGWNFC